MAVMFVDEVDVREKVTRPPVAVDVSRPGYWLIFRDMRKRLYDVLTNPKEVVKSIIKGKASICIPLVLHLDSMYDPVKEYVLHPITVDEPFLHTIRNADTYEFLTKMLMNFSMPHILPDGRGLDDMQFPTVDSMIEELSKMNPWWLYEMYCSVDGGCGAPSEQYNYIIDQAEYSAIIDEMKRWIKDLDDLIDQTEPLMNC